MWNKLGSTLEISNSAYGPALSNVGVVSFSNGQFGNGFKPAAASWLEGQASNYINSNKGTIEFWVNPEAGLATGGGQNFFFEFTTNGQTSGNFLGYNIQTGGTLQFGVTFGAAVVDLRPTATFTTGTPAHIAFVWDCSGIGDGSGQTHQVYKDGVKIGGHTNANAKMPSYSISSMRVGTSWDNNGRQLKGIMDNLKFWNYAKTNFSDRFTE